MMKFYLLRRVSLLLALLGRCRHLRYFRFGWERTLVNQMPDECKIGIEVNPKGRAGKADYSWHQPVSGESALGRLMMPARQATSWPLSNRACRSLRRTSRRPEQAVRELAASFRGHARAARAN